MQTLVVETFIKAPPDRCFDLARDIDVHVRSAVGTRERAIGAVRQGKLALGDEVTWQGTHFGFRLELTSRISRFEPPHLFEDEQIRGPFAALHHVHEFMARDGGTQMRDVFVFAAPWGVIGRVVEVLVLRRYFDRFLQRRARALKSLAERSNSW